MPPKCPQISETLIFAGNSGLAAQLSCLFAAPAVYVPIMDAPRLQRPDGRSEIVRRGNAAARSRARRFIFAGLTDEECKGLATMIPARRTVRIDGTEALEGFIAAAARNDLDTITWGRDRIGIGLLKAFRAKAYIRFEDSELPREALPSKSDHLVVCEQGEELSEVIAANYAYALGADLVLIPERSRDEAAQFLERFYSANDPGVSTTRVLEELARELRGLAGDIPVPRGGSITFICRDHPYGFGFSEVPSTHLFTYPDLGIAVIHGFAAEQPKARGVQVATLVDPGTTDAQEIDAAVTSLSERGKFARVYRGPLADVRSVNDMMELFPYDLLVIATHCGDSDGYRQTYEFTDSEGRHRTFVVDVALGIGRTDYRELLQVTEFQHFVSLDGVDWDDPHKEEKLYVGTAMLDYHRLIEGPNGLRPSISERVKRVRGSAAMKMFDNNLIALPRTLAAETTPIIINNACVSWHRLAGDFMFGGARAYVGTLVPVLPFEAQDIVTRVLGKHFGKPLAHAFWAAQRESYGENGIRRPYVVTGAYSQTLRGKIVDVPRHIVR